MWWIHPGVATEFVDSVSEHVSARLRAVSCLFCWVGLAWETDAWVGAGFSMTNTMSISDLGAPIFAIDGAVGPHLKMDLKFGRR